jgi:hypothetical protein
MKLLTTGGLSMAQRSDWMSRCIWSLPIAGLLACNNGALTCKDAVNRARASIDISLDEAAALIGRCEQRSWTSDQRSCIGSAHALDELTKCVAPADLDGVQAAGVAAAFAKMASFRDQMCACTTSACASQVSDEMTKWSQAQGTKALKMTDEDTRRATAIGVEMGKCMQKTSSAKDAIAKMGEFKDKMCACSDTACAQNVSDEMAKWSQQMAKYPGGSPKMTDEETKRATQIGEDMGRCMQKAMGAGRGGE